MDHPTPEEDVVLARRALSSGDLTHAAFHMACALAEDPDRQDWLSFLDQVLDAGGDDPLALAPIDDTPYFGIVAVHAYALARLGDYSEALRLLFQVFCVRPDVPYLKWAEAWVNDPKVIESLEPELANSFLAALLEAFPGVAVRDPVLREQLATAIPVIDQMLTAGKQDPRLGLLAASLYRKSGQLERALETALVAFDAEPSWHTGIGIALVYRAMDAVDDALDAYRNALTYDPEDISARLDMADMLCEAGRLEEGLAVYQEVLDREPEHAWALPSYFYNQWFHDHDAANLWFDKLDAIANDPDHHNEHAMMLRDELDERRTPYVGYLPSPMDAGAKVLSQITREIAGRGDEPGQAKFSLSVSHLEAPSVSLAFDVQLRALGCEPQLDFTVSAIPDPDPRLPKGPVEFKLWEYDNHTPRPGVDAPPSEVSDAIASLVTGHYRVSTWTQRARDTAERLGTRAARDIAAVMVHPPRLPDEMPAWVWIQRVQVAAALVIAHLDAGWAGSTRKKHLFNIALGPTDWAVDAAIVALTQVAVTEPDARKDVNRLFADLFSKIPDNGYCCYEYPLVCNWLRVPEIDPARREQLSAVRVRLEGT